MIMDEQSLKALTVGLTKHIKLSRSRQETLGWLVYLVMRQGTICLWRLASYVTTSAMTDSVRRRFYRFFQHVKLDGCLAARVVVDLLGLSGKPWVLAMDRTNWDFGKTSINILMVSVMWNGVGIPLIWTLLPKTGNSDTQTRTDLLGRLLATFPEARIASLMGDREFIGEVWMSWLRDKKIEFILRLKENQHVIREGYATWAIADIAKGLARGEKLIVKGSCQLGQTAKDTSLRIRLVIMRLKTGELLALACTGNPRWALEHYRRRWTIETLFGNLKTKGFNLEDTHITDRDKLSTLLVILAMAVALSVKTGVAMARIKPIPVKKHGRKAYSLFALGLSTLRKIFAISKKQMIRALIEAIVEPKIRLKPLKNMNLRA